LNDSYGGSFYTINTPFGSMTSDTLRYAQSTGMMAQGFGNLSGSNIVEFGPFYGGLAHCMLSFWTGSIGAYYMVDLPEVMGLSQAYFNSMSVQPIMYNTASLIYGGTVPTASYIFISEYALTEFTEPDLTNLFNQYVTASDAFFIRTNFADVGQYISFVASCSAAGFIVSASAEPAYRKPNIILIGVKK